MLSRSGKKEGIDFKHNKWIYFIVLAAVLGAISGLYDKYLMAPPEKLGVKDEFTPEQRFFLAWARVWAGNARPEYLQYLMTVDVHSPNEARVNGALPMVDSWYKAFNIKKGDKLFVPKNKRAHIW